MIDKRIIYKDDGRIYIEYYDDKIIETFYEYGEGIVSIIYKNKNNQYHREDGPAVIINNNGKIKLIEYYINNKLHRSYGPAQIFYNKNGTVKDEEWFHNGYNYSYEVNNWMLDNNLNYKTMNETQFNQMWLELL